MTSSPPSRYSRPTSAPAVDETPSSISSIHLQRSSSSTDQSRVSKRKGTRSVSTLTPAQLARKRANDREAQRAIRARTKEHIERLEAELEELRSHQQRDQTVQELLRRNKMLEDELRALRESMGLSFNNNASSYSTPATLNSPRTSPYPTGDFTPNTSAPLATDPSSYFSFANPNNCENWAATVSASVPSNVSSPGSSAADDFGATAAYLPTSAPNPMVQSSPVPVTSGMTGREDVKIEYEDGNDHGFPLENRSPSNNGATMASNAGTPPMSSMPQGFMMPQQPSQPQQHPGAWGANNGMYYTSMPHPVY